MFNKKNLLIQLSLVAAMSLSITACNSGTSSGGSPTPNPSPTPGAYPYVFAIQSNGGPGSETAAATLCANSAENPLGQGNGTWYIFSAETASIDKFVAYMDYNVKNIYTGQVSAASIIGDGVTTALTQNSSNTSTNVWYFPPGNIASCTSYSSTSGTVNGSVQNYNADGSRGLFSTLPCDTSTNYFMCVQQPQ